MAWSSRRPCRCGALDRTKDGLCNACRNKRDGMKSKEREAKGYAKPAARGYDAEWLKVKRATLDCNPFCARCGERARLVHHIVSVRSDPARRLDPSNLLPLCYKCHGQEHRSDTRILNGSLYEKPGIP